MRRSPDGPRERIEQCEQWRSSRSYAVKVSTGAKRYRAVPELVTLSENRRGEAVPAAPRSSRSRTGTPVAHQMPFGSSRKSAASNAPAALRAKSGERRETRVASARERA